MGAAVAVPALLTYGLMRAASRARRLNIEDDIRQVELDEKRVALRQRRTQELILEEIHDALRQERSRNPDYRVPESVIAAAVQVSAPSVAELGSSPLIEKISFNASIGGKAG